MTRSRVRIPSLFVSYSRRDQAQADRLAPLLARVLDKCNLWMDPEMPPGEKWWRKIVSEIQKRDCLLLLASKEAWSSVYCRAELTEAWRYGHTVVVARIGGAEVPKVVSNEVQWVDLNRWRDDVSNSEAFAEILSGILLPQAIAPVPPSSLWAGRGSNGTEVGIKYSVRVPALVEPDNVGAALCNTGVLLLPGDRIRIRATGSITFDTTYLPYNASGLRPGDVPGQWIFYESDRAYPTEENPTGYKAGIGYIGSIMGWVGDGSPENAFFVGRERDRSILEGESGFLHLAVNDAKGEYIDNTGAFDVTIEHVHATDRPK